MSILVQRRGKKEQARSWRRKVSKLNRCSYVLPYTGTHVHLGAWTQIYTHVHRHIHTCTACMYICMHTDICIDACNTYVHILMYTYTT